MKLDQILSDLDVNIVLKEKEISVLKNKKDKFSQIYKQYPDAEFDKNRIGINNIWNKITCMQINTRYDWSFKSSVYLRFLMGEKHQIQGMRVCSLPFDTKIADIRPINGDHRNKEIIIYDFRSIIPVECNRKKSFLKRIKYYLIDSIKYRSLTVNEESYYKDEITNLLLLR